MSDKIIQLCNTKDVFYGLAESGKILVIDEKNIQKDDFVKEFDFSGYVKVNIQEKILWRFGAPENTSWSEAQEWSKCIGGDCGDGWELPSVSCLLTILKNNFFRKSIQDFYGGNFILIWTSSKEVVSLDYVSSHFLEDIIGNDDFKNYGYRAIAIKREQGE